MPKGFSCKLPDITRNLPVYRFRFPTRFQISYFSSTVFRFPNSFSDFVFSAPRFSVFARDRVIDSYTYLILVRHQTCDVKRKMKTYIECKCLADQNIKFVSFYLLTVSQISL